MQSSSTHNDHDHESEHNESSQAVTDCLRTPVILRLILQHFSKYELLELSLVNKLWNLEARRLLRDREFLSAKISSKYPCQDLKAFASDLKSMNVVPFSGMMINLISFCDGIEGCLATKAAGLDPSYDVILHRLQWKYLYVRFNYNYEGSKNCPAFLLVTKILADFGGVLERLSVFIESGRADFIQQVLQDCSFPRLQALRLHNRYETTTEDNTNLIKALVSRAPNLRVLYIYERVDLMENLLKGCSAYISTNYDVSPTVDGISQSLIHALRMTRVKLREISQDLSLERNMVLPLLLYLSSATLNYMDIDAVFLVPLMYYMFECRTYLANVTQLQMHFNCLELYQPRILNLIKSFDFTRSFPRLTRVQAFGFALPSAALQSHIIKFIEQCNPAVRKPRPDRAANIKRLALKFSPILKECSPAGFLPEMFPHVERLSVAVFKGQIIPSMVLEQHWAGLKDLEVVKVESKGSIIENLDSAFCGVFPEEVARLREEDDEYLKAVNIVPVMPSIGCLKGLKSLTYQGARYAFFVRGPTHEGVCDPAFMLSKVAGLVAFKRCPGLSVTLKTDDYEVFKALDHMKPYARVVYGLPIVGDGHRPSLEVAG